MNSKVIFAFIFANVILVDSKPAAYDFASLENAIRDMGIQLKHGHSMEEIDSMEEFERLEDHGHSVEKRQGYREFLNIFLGTWCSHLTIFHNRNFEFKICLLDSWTTLIDFTLNL